MFSQPYLTPREAQSFPIRLPGIIIDDSLELKVIKAGDDLFEVEYETIVALGENVLYRGSPKEYEDILEKITEKRFRYRLDQKGELGLVFY